MDRRKRHQKVEGVESAAPRGHCVNSGKSKQRPCNQKRGPGAVFAHIQSGSAMHRQQQPQPRGRQAQRRWNHRPERKIGGDAAQVLQRRNYSRVSQLPLRVRRKDHHCPRQHQQRHRAGCREPAHPVRPSPGEHIRTMSHQTKESVIVAVHRQHPTHRVDPPIARAPAQQTRQPQRGKQGKKDRQLIHVAHILRQPDLEWMQRSDQRCAQADLGRRSASARLIKQRHKKQAQERGGHTQRPFVLPENAHPSL